eukprot:CAMPEP_0206507648 /NCGR_PEP_ID=MMETSP0324_2-20121206/57681_1 /ASSEMBLY_ACC=CAM_ASM_000836 /TAXON_ID=2866 /ORGANISM="Crypthecodinium cohnii, Strain Seligo" /LENGTH=110 /DNA_ID=CAMNT_0053997999 /DNA_START=147 /DNA_END=482 /DNA_ORIENTATION=+
MLFDRSLGRMRRGLDFLCNRDRGMMLYSGSNRHRCQRLVVVVADDSTDLLDCCPLGRPLAGEHEEEEGEKSEECCAGPPAPAPAPDTAAAANCHVFCVASMSGRFVSVVE